MTPNCIDVSTWQRNIDWQRVKAAGIKAVIIRAGFGVTKDNQFENHYAGARAAGLYIGAYWYSYAYDTDRAEREANACASVLSGKSFDIPIYYDMEEDDQMPLGRATMTAIACRFLDTLQSKGYRVGMYSSPSWFTDFLDYDLLRSKYSIWLAHWASRHTRACDIWQYGENGSIDGVSGDVDVNIIENWNVVSGGEKPEPTPAPEKPTVKTVQKWLNETYSADLTVDGIYGRLTKAALVRALQTELNRSDASLEVDGIFGSKTKAAVKNLSAGSKGELTAILQALLLCKGYPSGGFDGIFGAGTEAAVREFQHRAAITVDGVAGKMTFEKLCG